MSLGTVVEDSSGEWDCPITTRSGAFAPDSKLGGMFCMQ